MEKNCIPDPTPNHAANPAIASLLQSWRPAGRVAELGSLGRFMRLVKKKTPEQQQFERDFALVAGMSGDQKTVTHIHGLLRSAGIRCTSEGSVVYDLYVERTQVERALQLLRAERASGYHAARASLLLRHASATKRTF